jgi:hypothetical protein
VREGKVYTAYSTGHARRLVSSGISPDWWPNGRRLALVRPLPTATFGRSHPVWSPDGRWLAYDGFDLGVHVKRVGSSAQAKEIAPTQISGESGSVASFDPAWRPR